MCCGIDFLTDHLPHVIIGHIRTAYGVVSILIERMPCHRIQLVCAIGKFPVQAIVSNVITLSSDGFYGIRSAIIYQSSGIENFDPQ